MRVKRDWWKDFFNDIYLITDARSVCDIKLTQREVSLLEDILSLRKDDTILDLCGGQGRHSLELAKRGYRNITVLDFSKYLINHGKEQARKIGVNVNFVCRDARFTGLKDNYYTVVFIMANSFGYFQNDKDNLQILRESYRLLRKNGRLFLDIADADYIKSNFTSFSWHEADSDIIVCRKRELKKDLIKTREIVISKTKGLLRDGYYCECIYDKQKIHSLLKTAGFGNISIKGGISLHKRKGDYGFLTTRTIVTAEKL